MAENPQKYKEFERYMTIGLCVNTALFIFYLIAAGNGVIWLKALLALLGIGLACLILWLLYKTNEMLRQRSLWMTTAAAAIAVCIFFSLILNFPSPNKYKHQPETKTEDSTIAVTDET